MYAWLESNQKLLFFTDFISLKKQQKDIFVTWKKLISVELKHNFADKFIQVNRVVLKDSTQQNVTKIYVHRKTIV